MKILVNRKPYYGPYGGGQQFVNNFWSYFQNKGHKITDKILDYENIDLLILVDPRWESESFIGTSWNVDSFIHDYSGKILDGIKKIHPNIKIIHRINECDERKKTNIMDQSLTSCSKRSNKSCFIGRWIKEYHLNKEWHCKNNHVIHSGCNQGWFKPNKKYSDVDGKVHIVSHHWSDNSLKEQGLNQWLDEFVGRNKDFTFTYIGRTNVKFENAKHIQPLFGQALGDELGKYDLCINKSFADPFPNSCIEILSCKIPLYSHVEGGGALEAAGEDHSFDTFEDLEKILLSKDYPMNTAFVPYSWEECMQRYEKVINELME